MLAGNMQPQGAGLKVGGKSDCFEGGKGDHHHQALGGNDTSAISYRSAGRKQEVVRVPASRVKRQDSRAEERNGGMQARS